jgi:hypothetical protein
MSDQRPSHAVYDLQYHGIWITNYRKPALRGDIALRAQELTRRQTWNSWMCISSLALLNPTIHDWVRAGLGLKDNAYNFWMRNEGLDRWSRQIPFAMRENRQKMTAFRPFI